MKSTERGIMALEVQVDKVDTHLSIKAAGQYTLTNLYDLFDRVKAESLDRADRGVILDVTEVAGAIPILDMHVLGEHCSRVWKPPFRIAVISPEGGLDKFFENVVWNRGIQIAVVPTYCAAVKWVNWEQ
jgi:hypothetical protein